MHSLHPHNSPSANKEDCPFLNKGSKEGGCPVMKNPKKRNPGLSTKVSPSYDVKYISTTGSLVSRQEESGKHCYP